MSDSPRRTPIGPLAPADVLGPLNDVERRYAPPHIYMAGDRDVLHAGPRVAVIGSRRASAAGLANTRAIAETLVQRGIVVVSGLAEGIDTAAHQTAIACGGRAIAVLGTPVDVCYPARATWWTVLHDPSNLLKVCAWPTATPRSPIGPLLPSRRDRGATSLRDKR